MYFKFKPEVVFTKGKDGSILSNLMTGRKIYLDSADTRRAEVLYNNDRPGRVPPDAGNLTAYLAEQGFGQFHERNIHVEKIKTSRIATLKYDKLIPFKLNRLVLEVTGSCNLNCLFCTEENIVYQSCGCKKWENSNELSERQWKNIISQAMKLGIQECFLTGGEPLLKWNLVKELVSYLHDHHIAVTLFTNGTLLNASQAKFLKEKKVSLALQIFGEDNQRYEMITQCANMYCSVENAIQWIDHYQIPHTVSIIVSSLNESAVEAIKSKLGERSYQMIYIYPANPYSSSAKRQEMLNPLLREIPVHLDAVPYLMRYNNCLYGQIFVSGSGEVYPCMMLRSRKLGSLDKDRLWEIFARKEHKPYWEMSKTKINHCSQCERNLFCFDCRALDFYGSNELDGMVYCNRIHHHLNEAIADEE
ncbi:radical SAM protein [Paenibacillus woosongensis]|uniref:Radical SAM protein n=1 Tax=Paenibacillus woosongensis TaxID=307580 RepID=A0AA95L1H8_9BACL|nr:radical SAM protein [Paenibacillus woosongensis]WHX47892.1 radical SAM protein [Paenibacillus woosongensis]